VELSTRTGPNNKEESWQGLAFPGFREFSPTDRWGTCQPSESSLVPLGMNGTKTQTFPFLGPCKPPCHYSGSNPNILPTPCFPGTWERPAPCLPKPRNPSSRSYTLTGHCILTLPGYKRAIHLGSRNRCLMGAVSCGPCHPAPPFRTVQPTSPQASRDSLCHPGWSSGSLWEKASVTKISTTFRPNEEFGSSLLGPLLGRAGWLKH